MSPLRRLDTHHKLFISFALLLCMGAGLTLWLLGQLELVNTQLSLLTAAKGQKLSVVNIQLSADLPAMRQLAALALGATAVSALLLACWLGGDIRRPVHAAGMMARHIAEGDLSTRIALELPGAGGDLLGSMQNMNDKLAGIVVKLRTGAQDIAGSAGQLAASSMTLASRSNEQAAALSHSVSALAQLASQVQQHSEGMGQAGALALTTARLLDRGAALLADTRATPGTTAAQADQAGRVLSDMATGVGRLCTIVGKLADSSAAHGATLARLGQALAVSDLANRAQLAQLAQAAAAAAAIRDEAGGLSRATASFVLGSAYATPAPRIHLVSSNPHLLTRARSKQGVRPRPAIVAPASAPPMALPLRSRGGAGRSDTDWGEF
jgi:methyl-accepting chemotaxis protein